MYHNLGTTGLDRQTDTFVYASCLVWCSRDMLHGICTKTLFSFYVPSWPPCYDFPFAHRKHLSTNSSSDLWPVKWISQKFKRFNAENSFWYEHKVIKNSNSKQPWFSVPFNKSALQKSWSNLWSNPQFRKTWRLDYSASHILETFSASDIFFFPAKHLEGFINTLAIRRCRCYSSSPKNSAVL